MFSVIKNGDRENYGVNYYIVDRYDELDNILGAASGSKAYVIEKKKNYIKSANENWEEYVSAIGGGVGDAVQFIGIATQLPTGSEVTLTDGSIVQAEQGDIIFVDTDSTDDETAEYIWNGKSWQWLDGGSGEVFTKVYTTDGGFQENFNADTKLDKVTNPVENGVYGVIEKKQIMVKLDYANTASVGAIPQRGVPHGALYIKDESITTITGEDNIALGQRAVNKNYVDNTIPKAIHIGDEPPTNTLAQLWIDTDEDYALINIEGVSF